MNFILRNVKKIKLEATEERNTWKRSGEACILRWNEKKYYDIDFDENDEDDALCMLFLLSSVLISV